MSWPRCRSTVDLLSMRLSSEGIAVAGYHAALPAAKREDVLQQWRAGLLQVVVATVAFGMGVDKGDVCWHWCPGACSTDGQVNASIMVC